MEYLENHPECVLLGTWTNNMDAAGRVVAPNISPTSHDDIDERNLRGTTCLVHPTVMIRKQAFDTVGGYDANYPASEDQELWLRLAEIGQIANLPDVLLDYRIHGDSVSAREDKLQAASCEKACNDAARRRGVEPVFAFKEWRMQDDRASRRDFSIKYAWDAWNWGNLGTWRHYAMKSVLHDPFSMNAWKTLVMGGLRISKSGRSARGFANRND
jgi:GT2 family glycosyltransferase